MSKSIEQRICLKFCIANGISCAKSLKMLKKAYGKSSISRTRIYGWYKEFKEGRDRVKDLPRSGRPRTPHNEVTKAKVKEILAQNRHISLRSIAAQVSVSYHSIRTILKELGRLPVKPRVHGETAMTFSCDTCRKVFKTKFSLNIHEKSVHLNIEPHSCRTISEIQNDLRLYPSSLRSVHRHEPKRMSSTANICDSRFHPREFRNFPRNSDKNIPSSSLHMQQIKDHKNRSSHPCLIEETPAELGFTAKEVAQSTKTDNILSKILYLVRNGWPATIGSQYKLYWQKREELSTFKDCILWGSRVVLPEDMRLHVLEELHSNHDGIVSTKAVARSYFWWPAIDKQIEQMIRNCHICSEKRNMPIHVTHHFIKPDKAWSRVHVDYAGPFQNKLFLILIDAYSKWPEIKIVPDMSSQALIKSLREIFAEQGLPDTIVSDHVRSFISEEYKRYLTTNGIRRILVSPYHPASNGQSERTMQIVKNKLKKMSMIPWHKRLPKILYELRTTPNSVNDKTPAEMLNNRKFRSKFDQLNPLSEKNNGLIVDLEENENLQIRVLKVGQSVYVKNYGKGSLWLKGVVERNIGVTRYLVRWNGKRLIRHINQIHKGGVEEMEKGKPYQDIESDDENNEEDSEGPVILPPQEKWEDMIGVSGPQDIIIHDSQERPAPCSWNKRAFYISSEASPQYKRRAVSPSSSDKEQLPRPTKRKLI